MASRDNMEIFDTGLYFAIVRNERIKQGYRKAEDFLQDMEEQTGVKIGIATYYKLEQGQQAPLYNQLLAINFMLFNSLDVKDPLFSLCLTENGKRLVEEND